MARRSKYIPSGHKVRVGKSSAGLGLYAVEEIPKGICFIEYFGRVIKGQEEYTSRSKYLFEVHSRKTIDGRQRDNIARYINHSCRPNAEPETHKGRVYIFSRRKILPGEEITYDYGKEYWEEHIGKEKCRCPKCVLKRGTKN
ncbi:MAG: SET domain-containing protein [Candidatus Taylorbacteria bacterium]|nr:SET domain-containing protein [Candidatus Taylorbacteria bacterium]